MKMIVGFVSGIIFSVGLIISGMINPQKVLGFLDIFGNWDISLAFVMGGAVTINLITFNLIKRREKPVCAAGFDLPTNRAITNRLIVGAILFGLGWGIAGICPGPALVNLVSLKFKPMLFVLSMIVGMLVFKKVDANWRR